MTDYSGDIAIIGMAGLYPDAADIDVFWENILAGHDAVGDAPEGWLGCAGILDPDADDLQKIYSAKGGFLGDLARFDASAFNTMPFSVEGAQPDQFLALQTCHDALLDAGYAAGGHDHVRTGVILGHTIHTHRANANGMQQFWFHAQMRELLAVLFPEAGRDRVQAAIDMMQARLPRISTDSLPGLVPNILTGRIANRLDLMGPNYVIDAACSSSLIAVDLAMTELRERRADLMLAGGVNTTTSPPIYGIFCSVGALSRAGLIRPFSTHASGTVLGEGVGAIVLKRLEDAMAADDRIYAVIKTVGQSSDGKSNGLMAPRLEGEILAMRRAYEQSGIDPASIGLIEAHGTGIPLGDQIEIAAMREVFGVRDGLAPRVPVGSVKSMIGHCIPAAGSASIIKTALALSRRILPPTLCDDVSEGLGLDDAPFYISTETRPWLHSGDGPRRAAINAFGFGGVNAHMVLEEPPGGVQPDVTAAFLRSSAPDRFIEAIFVLKGATAGDVVTAATALKEAAEGADQARFAKLSRDCWDGAQTAGGAACVAIVASDPRDLVKKLETAREKLSASGASSLQTRHGVYFEAAPMEGKLAFLFPGEMAQYPGMLQDALMAFPEIGDWFEALARLFDARRNARIGDVAFPPPNGLSDETRARLHALLHQVDYGSELVFAADQAMREVLLTLGLEPEGMLGHSTGENAAIVASGRLRMGRAEVAKTIASMNAAFCEVQESGAAPKGVLLTVAGLSRDAFLTVFQDFENVHWTMDNCPNQVIAFGVGAEIDALEAELVEAGAVCSRLPISWGYHTDHVAPLAERFGGLFRASDITSSDVTLYSCATAAPFPEAPEDFVETALAQYVSKVRFTDAVERLYADGYRIFVECGPNATLTPFVRDILGERRHLAESADNRRRDTVSQLRHLLARLISAGVGLPYPDLLNPAASPNQARRAALRAQRRKAPVLETALPFVRFSGAEADDLRKLLVTAARDGREPAVVAGTHGVASPVQAHLGMMRQFLQSQEPVAHAGLAAPACRRDQMTGRSIAMVDLAKCFDPPFAFRGFLMHGAPDPEQVWPYLSPSEQAEADKVLAQRGRWSGWALSRLAAKRSARDLLAHDGLALRDDEIEIWNTDNGAPCLRVADMNGSTPSVSLTHAGGSAAACVSAPIWRIGLDYDDPARVRDPGAFLVSILSARERERLSPPKTADAATMLWCVKEAAAKTLGRGLQGRPETFEITKIAEGCGSARVAHDGTTLDMRIARIGAGFCALGFLRAS